MKHKDRKASVIPDLWWDYYHSPEMSIHVEAKLGKKFFLVKKFPCKNRGDEQIEQAEQLIQDIKSGRISFNKIKKTEI